MKSPKSHPLFTQFAKVIARATGRPTAFLTACALVVVWGLLGPYFHYSTDWQLVINTGTTIVTFLMVFLIQNTQNRESEAMHLKLDELIRAMEGAHNALLDLEELEECDLDTIRMNYLDLAKSAREAVRKGEVDTGRVEFKGAETAHGARRTEQIPPE
jgi:low affinity Fe/Cu permease